MSKRVNISLIGRSGCGKGTQAKLLMKHFDNIFYLSTGDLFRKFKTIDTAVSRRIQKILKEGGLPFDDLATTLWMHEIAFNAKEDQGVIFDGAPRRLPEAKNMIEFMDWLDRGDEMFFVLLDISRQEAFDRLTKRRICKKCGRLIPWVGDFRKIKVCDKCGGQLITRPDDNVEAINNRLDYYEERMIEMIEYLEKENRLIKINGEQPIGDVFKDIIKALDKK